MLRRSYELSHTLQIEVKLGVQHMAKLPVSPYLIWLLPAMLCRTLGKCIGSTSQLYLYVARLGAANLACTGRRDGAPQVP
eukprot:4308941-Pleurochrysis_carterae.AAC.5